MRITDEIWIDPKEVTAMIMDRSYDNYTRGMTIHTKTDKFYVKHQPPWVSVYDIEKKIVSARE